MARPSAGSPLTQPSVRRVLGRLCFAAAAEVTGVWGSTRLEQLLGFRPALRAQRGAGPSAKKPASAGTCKRWLKGHVPDTRTVALIASIWPAVAERISHWLGSRLPSVLATNEGAPRGGIEQLVALKPELCDDYLAALAFGMANPQITGNLCDHVTRDAFRKSDSDSFLLAVLLARGLNHQVGDRQRAQLKSMLKIGLRAAARTHREIRYIEPELEAIVSSVDAAPPEHIPNRTSPLISLQRARQTAWIEKVRQELAS